MIFYLQLNNFVAIFFVLVELSAIERYRLTKMSAEKKKVKNFKKTK
jgi:hypothetical protein